MITPRVASTMRRIGSGMVPSSARIFLVLPSNVTLSVYVIMSAALKVVP